MDTILLEGEAHCAGRLISESCGDMRRAHVQDVIYENKEHLDKVLGKLRRLPPLVSPVEVSSPVPRTCKAEHQIDRLRAQLADVAAGKAFLLQGGDCAELFDDCAQVSSWI